MPTPIFGPTTITLDEALTWAQSENAPPRAATIIVLYFQHAPRYGIPVENALGQSSWETNYWKYTGQVPPHYNNMAGIKTKTATGDKPEDHFQFPTQEAGVVAHLQHLAGYGGKKEHQLPDPLIDPRFHMITNFTSTMEGLGGSWAPSPIYGANVSNRIAEVKSFGGPMDAQIKGFKLHLADDQHHTKGRAQKVRGGAQHYSAGVNSLEYLSTNPSTNVSATFLVKANPTLTDRGWQLVWIEDTPHTTGFPVNDFTVSIEYEHLATDPIPAIAYEVLARTWFDVDGYLRASGGGAILEIKGHNTWVGDNRVCPNGIDIARIVRRFNELKGAMPVDDPNSYQTGTGLFIVNTVIAGRSVNMLDTWKKRGGFKVCGDAREGMVGVREGDQLTYRQVFDNVGIALYPDGSDRFYGIGMELVAAKKRIAELEEGIVV